MARERNEAAKKWKRRGKKLRGRSQPGTDTHHVFLFQLQHALQAV
jgi:hypothetical protein